MSSAKTHTVIGAVGGLVLLRWAPHLLPPQLDQLAGGNAIARTILVLVLTAALSTWPDIDEPGSWIARHMRRVCVLLGLVLGALVGLAGPFPVLVLATVVGANAGLLLGLILPRLVRRAAGGHRRFTHSLVLAGLLVGGALLLPRLGLPALAVVPGALALGLLLHLPGDLVTPAGLPLLYPLSERSLRLLPRPLAPFGEQLILTAALIVGVLLGAR